MSYWKKCSNCKKELRFEEIYQACSISSCNHSRSGLQFCTVSCWSAHVPIYRHKDAWAIEKKAPTESEWLKLQGESSTSVPSPQRRIVGLSVSERSAQPKIEKEILVVVSKLKGYIAGVSEMNTSADVMEKLSDHLREICDKAIKNAQGSGRKTVMARDFPV